MGTRFSKAIGLLFTLFLFNSSALAQVFNGTNPPGSSTNFVFSISAASITNFTLIMPGTTNAYSYLYLRRGVAPTESVYDYVSRFPGQANNLTLELPQAVRTNWHVRVVTPPESSQHAFTLTVRSNVANARVARPVNKPLSFSLAGTVYDKSWNYYQVEMPTNPVIWKVLLSSAMKSPDLYIQQGKLPTLGSYLKRSVGQTNDVLSFTDTELSAGTYFIGVYSPAGSAAYTLKTEVLKIHPLVFDPGLTADGTEVFTNKTALAGDTYFKIRTENPSVGAWRTALKVTSGEANLFMTRGSLPVPATAAYQGRRVGSDGFTLAPGEYTAGQDWYIMVRATANAQWTLVSGAAFVTDLGELATDGSSGAEVTIGPEGWHFFKTTTSQDTLAWRLWLRGAKNNIFVKRTTVPLSASGKYELKQANQMLVVPPYLLPGQLYFVGVPGDPGTVVKLDSRSQQIQDINFIHNDATLTNITGYGYTTYRVEVPANEIAWQVDLTTTNGNPNLYVRRDFVPNESYNSAFSENSGGTSESISLVPPTLTDGTFFITVAAPGVHSFRLKSGPPTVTDINYVGQILNEEPNQVGWRYFRVTDIESQLGSLGWELLLSNSSPGSRIALRRNYAPGLWSYRNGSSPVSVKFYDYLSLKEWLHRPNHQADVWYIGVYNPSQILRKFTLTTKTIPVETLAGDGGKAPRTNVPGRQWEYFRVDVPEDVEGWDIRLNGVKGGNPRLIVSRQTLPGTDISAGVVTTNLSTTLGSPGTTTNWLIDKQWVANKDWTGRTLSPVGTNETGRILAMGMGRPLQPGTYYIGVHNASDAPTSFVLLSRFIGAGRQIPVTDLAYVNGTATNPKLAPRAAAYYRVNIPSGMRSWKVKLTMTSGEAMLLVSTNRIPNVESQKRVQKVGKEHYVLLPDKGVGYLRPGSYYLVVIGEGVNPQPNRIGAGDCSFQIQSVGPMPQINLGQLTSTPLLHTNRMEAGEVKHLHFGIGADVPGYELFIRNPVGNPVAVVRSGFMPEPILPDPGAGKVLPADPYGNEGGDNTAEAIGVTSYQLLSAAYPGLTETIMMKARPSGSVHSGAAFDLRIRKINPVSLTFDRGVQAITDHAAGSWRFFKVVIPPNAKGWDVRLVNVTAGAPKVIVGRQMLPIPWKNDGFSANSSDYWFVGERWAAAKDWTERSLSATGVNEDGRILAMGMGRPLVPDTYYVGVYSASAAAYTLSSRGIGDGFAIPVTDLAYAGGTFTSSSILPARQAAYFKVTVPSGMQSWKVSLTTQGGSEATMLVLKDALPNVMGSSSVSVMKQSSAGRKMKKPGHEEFLLLPQSKQTTLDPGDYYIAVASEGNNPTNISRVAPGKISVTLTSHGSLPLLNLGTVTTTVTNSATLRGGEVLGYRFEVPPGTVSVEARLENRVGNPVMVLRQGPSMPDPGMSLSGVGTDAYGGEGGETAGTKGGANVITFPNPTNGVYYLLVKARQTNSVFNNASFTLRLSSLGSTPLEFDGGQVTVANQTSGSWRYFRVDVPEDALGWDLRLTNVLSGLPRIVVCRDALPNGLSTKTWGSPGNQSGWNSTNQWHATTDWTKRQFSPSGAVDENGRILAMGMGRPLEPGSYYVGISSSTGTSPLSYTLVSRGIGDGYRIPVTELTYEGGSVTHPGLAPRDAAYFRVDVPTNASSLKLKLTGLSGEVMMLALRDFVPNVEYNDNSRSISLGKTFQKSGNEHFLLLPPVSENTLAPGPIYFAVVAEGAVTNANRIGQGNSSFTISSIGTLPVEQLGLVTSDNQIERVDSVEGGEVKAYHFQTDTNVYGVEMRLENRVGNPILSFMYGTEMPYPGGSGTGLGAEPYGNEGGKNGVSSPTYVTYFFPPTNHPLTNSITVKARAASGVYADASYRLRVKPLVIPQLNFSADQNGNGASNVVSGILENDSREFYWVEVPELAEGQLGWKLELSFASGSATIRVNKGGLPRDTPSVGTPPTSPAAYIVPPYLTAGTWFVEVRAQNSANYTLTSRPITLERPSWEMPAAGSTGTTPGLTHPMFGDTGIAPDGSPLPEDQSIYLERGYQHYYAFDVPEENDGLVRVILEAISGDPNLYVRTNSAPTVTHGTTGASGFIYNRSMAAANRSDYSNWVPIDGKTETKLRPGKWYFAVRAVNANSRYRVRLSLGNIQPIVLDGEQLTGQVVAGSDWRYYRFQMPTTLPNQWQVNFSKQVGDVWVYIRDTIPPGNGTSATDYRHWRLDAKNHGPYPDFSAAGTYTFNTPPTRPGNIYYIGVRGLKDATFSIKVSTTGAPGQEPQTINYWDGEIAATLAPLSEVTYRIDVPQEATRLKLLSSNAASVRLYMEQGTLPLKNSYDDWRPTGSNVVLNVALGTWPWVSNASYFLTVVNTNMTYQPLSIRMDNVVTNSLREGAQIANVVAPPAAGPRFTLPQLTVEQGLKFRVEGPIGQAYIVEGSTNLVDWSPITTITNNGADIPVQTTAGSGEVQFFRLRLEE